MACRRQRVRIPSAPLRGKLQEEVEKTRRQKFLDLDVEQLSIEHQQVLGLITDEEFDLRLMEIAKKKLRLRQLAVDEHNRRERIKRLLANVKPDWKREGF